MSPLRFAVPGEGPRVVAWLALRRGERTREQGAQELLGDLARRARLSDRDRALAFEIMQGVWRHRSLLDAAIARLEGFEKAAISPDLQEVLRLGAQQHFFLDRVPPHAVVHATVEAARLRLGPQAAGFANAVLQRLLAQFPDRGMDLQHLAEALPLAQRHSFPGWIVRLLKRTVGKEQLEAAVTALNRPLPLYGRVHPPFATPEQVVGWLSREGIDSRPRPGLAPFCIEINAPAGALSASAAFREGAVTIQDASAQLVSEFVGVRPGMTVVDFCAAPGGKATYLAAAMQGRGMLVACETAQSRLARLEENLARTGMGEFVGVRLLDRPQIVPGQEDADIVALLPGLHGGKGADRVLVDAPCSGLGTLRRHPEIRWRVRGKDLARLADLQGGILNRAAQLVRPGGWLVYATCSFADEENREVVEGFLEQSGGAFEILKSDASAHDTTGGVHMLRKRTVDEGWLRCVPGRDAMDSASAVRLRRMA